MKKQSVLLLFFASAFWAWLITSMMVSKLVEAMAFSGQNWLGGMLVTWGMFGVLFAFIAYAGKRFVWSQATLAVLIAIPLAVWAVRAYGLIG